MPFPLAAIPAILGGIQTIGGLIGQAQLGSEEFPLMKETPELRAARLRAEERAKRGFTPAEEAAFKANVATQTNTQRQNAIDMSGGSLASAVQGQLGINQLNAFNQFAGQDASLQRSNQQYADQFSKILQDIANQNTAMQQNIRLQSQQALGNAVKTGTENLVNSFGLMDYMNSFKPQQNNTGFDYVGQQMQIPVNTNVAQPQLIQPGNQYQTPGLSPGMTFLGSNQAMNMSQPSIMGIQSPFASMWQVPQQNNTPLGFGGFQPPQSGYNTPPSPFLQNYGNFGAPLPGLQGGFNWWN